MTKPVFIILSILGFIPEKEKYCSNDSSLVLGFKKIYSKIDQHLVRHFKYNGTCISSPPPFL